LLENYLKKLVSVEDIAKCETFIKFVTSDTHDEIKVEAKVSEDMPLDVEVTSVTIPATRTMSDHVLYQIDIVNARKRKSFSKWTVLKRFGQFYEMDQAVRISFVDNPEQLAQLPAPPQRRAKLLTDHMDTTFVESRRVLLENYLQRMVQTEHVVRNKEFLSFLGVDV